MLSFNGLWEWTQSKKRFLLKRTKLKQSSGIENIWQNGYRMGFYRGGPILMSALSGIDIALWDLKGMHCLQSIGDDPSATERRRR